jgi:hypothetical protein
MLARTRVGPPAALELEAAAEQPDALAHAHRPRRPARAACSSRLLDVEAAAVVHDLEPEPARVAVRRTLTVSASLWSRTFESDSCRTRMSVIFCEAVEPSKLPLMRRSATMPDRL